MTTERQHYQPTDDASSPTTDSPPWPPEEIPAASRADATTDYTPVRTAFGTAPDRISVQPRPGSPARIHVNVGDVVYEGDPRRLRRIGGRTPRIDAWEVAAITPTLVTAKHVDSGVEFDWDRTALETGLLTGRYAVDLVEFVAVGVRRNTPGHGRPNAVIATVYGNDGLRYVSRFIVVDEADDVTRVERWTETPAVSGLPDRLRKAYDRRVADALESHGYALA
jgi:hypothetical protein